MRYVAAPFKNTIGTNKTCTDENESATNEWYTYLYVACCLAGSAVPVHRFGVRICFVLLLCLLCIIMILGRERGFKDR